MRNGWCPYSEKVWLALDDDKSGFITAKEFGPFMKLGADDPGPTWKERLQASQVEPTGLIEFYILKHDWDNGMTVICPKRSESIP